MTQLTTEDCSKVIGSYLSGGRMPEIENRFQFAESLRARSVDGTDTDDKQVSKVLEKGWSMLGKYANTNSQSGKSIFGILSKGASILDETISKKEETKFEKPAGLTWLSSENQEDASAVADYLLRNIDRIQCVVDSKIIFFDNRFLFVGDLDKDSVPFGLSSDEYGANNISFYVDDLKNAEEWSEDFGGETESVVHFIMKNHRTGVECEALFYESSEGLAHIRKLRNLLTEYLANKTREEFGSRRSEVFGGLPIDDNGQLVLSDCSDLDKIMKAHQEAIIAIDRAYIQKFVKISQYLRTKKSNVEKIYKSLAKSSNIYELEHLFRLLEGEINTYNLVLLHSLNMVSSLVDDDMISFYETYELFDTLNMFDSQWEKDTAQRLDGISDQIQSMNDNLGSLLQDILAQSQRMEERIVNGINNLSQITAQGFSGMNAKLSAVHSTLRLNTLIGAVQLYQTNRRLS